MNQASEDAQYLILWLFQFALILPNGTWQDGIVAHQIPQEAITMNTFSNKLVPIRW